LPESSDGPARLFESMLRSPVNCLASLRGWTWRSKILNVWKVVLCRIENYQTRLASATQVDSLPENLAGRMLFCIGNREVLGMRKADLLRG